MGMEDRPSAVTDRMEFDWPLLLVLVTERFEFSGHIECAAIFSHGALSTPLHARPDLWAVQGPHQFLDDRVGGDIKNIACDPAYPLPGATQQLTDGLKQPRFPHKVNGIYVIFLPPGHVFRRDLQAERFLHQPAMRIQHHPQRCLTASGTLQSLGQIGVEYGVNISRRGNKLSIRRELPLLQIDDMRTQVVEGLGWQRRGSGPIAAYATSHRGSIGALKQDTHLCTAHRIVVRFGIGRVIPHGQGAADRFNDGPIRQHIAAKGAIAYVARTESRRELSGRLQCLHRRNYLLIVQAIARAGLGGHLIVEAQRFRRQMELLLYQCNDPKGNAALFALKTVVAVVEIADHLEHKWTGDTVAIMASRAGGWLIPVAASPDGTVRCNGNVLRDIAPAVGLGVKAPHRHDAVVALILAMIRAPGMVHMDGVNAPGKGKLVENPGKLSQRETMKRRRHNTLLEQRTGPRRTFFHPPPSTGRARGGLRYALPTPPLLPLGRRSGQRVYAALSRNSGFDADGIRTSATRRVEMPDLHEIAPCHEVGDNPCIQTHAPIVVFRHQGRLTVRAKELHHDIGLATGLNDMTARLRDRNGKEILLPRRTD